MSVLVRVQVVGAEEAAASFGRASAASGIILDNQLRWLADRLTNITQANAPRRTGALRRSISYRKTGPTEFQITEGQPYGLYQRMGTLPHPIYPRVKKALWWPGAAHPVRSVMHPGNKANDYAERAILDAIDAGIFDQAERIIGARLEFELA